MKVHLKLLNSLLLLFHCQSWLLLLINFGLVLILRGFMFFFFITFLLFFMTLGGQGFLSQLNKALFAIFG